MGCCSSSSDSSSSPAAQSSSDGGRSKSVVRSNDSAGVTEAGVTAPLLTPPRATGGTAGGPSTPGGLHRSAGGGDGGDGSGGGVNYSLMRSPARSSGTGPSADDMDPEEQFIANVAKEDERPQGDLNPRNSLTSLKEHKKGSRRYLLHQRIRQSLQQDNVHVSDMVKLPPHEDRNEWLALHVIDSYNDVSLLYGTISSHCSMTTCPVMCAGNHIYLWADGETVTTPIKVPAREYVTNLMNWVDAQISDETIFPIDDSQPFPSNFEDVVKTIFKRLFRVYAHMYLPHFKQFVDMQAHKHLNLCFKRFIFFVLEFKLVPQKDLEPLKAVITKLQSQKRD